jgi:hypothetical protein
MKKKIEIIVVVDETSVRCGSFKTSSSAPRPIKLNLLDKRGKRVVYLIF